MFKAEVTLRSLWESAQAHGQAGLDAVEKKSFVDWPIWLVVLSIPVALVALRLLLPIASDFVGLLVALCREISASFVDLARLSKRGRSRYPDPTLGEADRKMLAAHEGRFSDDPAERERWYNREGEYAED